LKLAGTSGRLIDGGQYGRRFHLCGTKGERAAWLGKGACNRAVS